MYDKIHYKFKKKKKILKMGLELLQSVTCIMMELLSRVWLFANPWTVTHQAPPSMGWVAISFSRGSSRPRDWTQVSHIVDRRFTVWATREVLYYGISSEINLNQI